MTKKTIDGITIDGDSSVELDDAFWVEETDTAFVLQVCIADVSLHINPIHNSFHYIKAFEKTESRYFANSNRPMLPRFLAESKLSLLPGRLKDVIVFTLVINKEDCELSEINIERGHFRNLKKMTYKEVDHVLESLESISEIDLMLKRANKLSQALAKKRISKGSLVMYNLQQGWQINEEGQMMKIHKEYAYRSYKIVEEFMIFTSIAVTEFMVEKDIPMILRNHTARSSAIPREQLLEHIGNLVTNPDQNQLNLMHKKLQLTLNSAEYGTQLFGHYGLDVAAYAHWTSPLRRFADLVNHVILSSWIDNKGHPYTNKRLESICTHINRVAAERIAKRKEFFSLENLKKFDTEVVSKGSQKKQFTELLKTYANSDIPIPKEVIELLEKRYSEKSLEIRDLSLIFFHHKFAILSEFRNKVFEFILNKKPFLALDIMSNAVHCKYIEQLVYRRDKQSIGHVYRARTRYNNIEVVGEKSYSTSKKETAMKIACVNLFIKLIKNKGALEKKFIKFLSSAR